MSVRRGPRVALVSVGLGRVQRGFERYFSDLFGVLREELDVTLYRSAGAGGAQEAVPPGLGPATRAMRALGRLAGPAEYHRDCLAFGLMLLPDLIRGRFDIVHCIDPPMAVVLQRLRRLTGPWPRLLFTEGCVMPPARYPRVDHVHHVAQAAFDAAVAAGVPASGMTLVPCGLHARRFPPRRDRAAARARLGLRETTFVVLAVSAVKREHKRVDHLVEEVASLDGDVLLWIDGNPEDGAVAALARDRLGERCRITHVRSDELGDLYSAADVLAHASLSESFGLAIVEAMCCELPVLVHDSPHFEWLVGDASCLVNMERRGPLAGRLREFQAGSDEASQDTAARANRVRARFDWSMLASAYVEMYRRMAALPHATPATRRARVEA